MAESITLGDVIRARRQQLGLTQEELAERIGEGVRQSDVSRLERGRVALPRRDRLQRIVTALNLPVGELLARSGWTEAASEEDRAVPAGSVASPRVATTAAAAGSPHHPRLAAVLRRSRELQEQSEQLLRRIDGSLDRPAVGHHGR